MPVKGTYLAIAGAGGLLLWSGLKGKQWSAVLRQLIAGKQPGAATTAYTISGTNPSAFGYGGMAGGTVGTPPAHSGFLWSHSALMGLWVSAGGMPSQANNAACHAIQESSGNPSVTSGNPDGGVNVGLWQLDTRGKGAGYTIAQLQNPWTNARVAVKGSNGGRDWSAWATPGC